MRWPIRWKNGESVILLYHRVANTTDDPHMLSVSPRNFTEQLEAMKKILPPLTIKQITDGIRRGKVPRGFAVTFDDGYADNFLEAFPILKKAQVPATIYAVSSQIDRKTPYYWDLDTKEVDRGRPMTLDELRQADREPLLEIGAHTMSHPHLGLENITKQKKEINGSKLALEKMLGHEVKGLAYPFGASEEDFTDDTKRLAAGAGFEYACVNIRGIIDKSFSDLYVLPRVLVRNWGPAKMLEEIKDVLPQ